MTIPDDIKAVVRAALDWESIVANHWELPDASSKGVTLYREAPGVSVEYALHQALKALSPESLKLIEEA